MDLFLLVLGFIHLGFSTSVRWAKPTVAVGTCWFPDFSGLVGLNVCMLLDKPSFVGQMSKSLSPLVKHFERTVCVFGMPFEELTFLEDMFSNSQTFKSSMHFWCH